MTIEPTKAFSVRCFLREREALLVHFSTPMSRHDYLFPNDLRNAMTLINKRISFSTIQKNDVGPFGRQGMAPADANGCGSVGIIVDVDDADSVVTVGAGDDGTYFDEATGCLISGGNFPSQAACDASIDLRVSANEWFVKNFRVLGVFVFFPILVRVKQVSDSLPEPVITEKEISLEQVLLDFSEQRVITVGCGQLWEYDRSAKSWRTTYYDSIVPCG
jgi:hypothetical protein